MKTDTIKLVHPTRLKGTIEYTKANKSLLMDKAMVKVVPNRIFSIFNIGTKDIGSDGLFRSDEVIYTLSKDRIGD